MLKKSIFALLMLFLALSTKMKADEGMWILSLINKNYSDMKAKGFKLSTEDIYNVNKACMKDAVVGLGSPEYPLEFFCTGEIISDEGLILTNHHCGFSVIQNFSSLEHDYLANGFWAKEKKEELTDNSINASILLRIEDITARIMSVVEGTKDELQRNSLIDKEITNIITETELKEDCRADVKKMFEGNQFFLFVYYVYPDVRLVGAPPSSIGKFGGDKDNWEWPRHTGDFSLFRIYTGKDGKSAKFSNENIPLKPKYFFPISLKGVSKDDFTMIMGFPGTTNR